MFALLFAFSSFACAPFLKRLLRYDGQGNDHDEYRDESEPEISCFRSGLDDNLVEESATEYAHDHIYADYGASWCDFLRESVEPCDLDRCHKKHVEFDHHVRGALEKHHPLPDFFQILIVHQTRGHEQNGLVEYLDGAEDKYWPENHPLLKDEVRHDHYDGESNECTLGKSDKRPFSVVVIIIELFD